VETAARRGTTFRVLLPRHVGESAGVAAPSLRQGDRSWPLGRESILVVEDEGTLRNVIRRMLSSAGYRVFLAASPGEALLLCEQHGSKLDLVLTDVVMPGMNGRELGERLLALYPSTKVMFMSGYTDEAIAHHGVLGRRFLRKPFDRETLTGLVRSVLDGAA
jgi:CheY-like chemotaxis protein